MDDLDRMLDREVILLGGSPGSGKSFSVAALVSDGLEQGFKVAVLDRDRGLHKVIRELFGDDKPENLAYFLLDEWAKAEEAANYALENLGPGDWFVFEMIGSIWDFAQTEYSRLVYDEGLTNHIMLLRAEAQEIIRQQGVDPKSKEARKITGEKIGFSGLDGRQDWSLIKRMHNNELFDKLIIRGDFNILSTTSMTLISNDEMEKHKYPEFESLGRRPEGEKHQQHRHDTLAVVDKKGGKWLARTDLGAKKGKDRGGRELFKELDITGIGFVAAYKEKFGL